MERVRLWIRLGLGFTIKVRFRTRVIFRRVSLSTRVWFRIRVRFRKGSASVVRWIWFRISVNIRDMFRKGQLQ